MLNELINQAEALKKGYPDNEIEYEVIYGNADTIWIFSALFDDITKAIEYYNANNGIQIRTVLKNQPRMF